jgi:hypothetical protein
VTEKHCFCCVIITYCGIEVEVIIDNYVVSLKYRRQNRETKVIYRETDANSGKLKLCYGKPVVKPENPW